MSAANQSSSPKSAADVAGGSRSRDLGLRVLDGGGVNPVFDAYARRPVARGSTARDALVAALAAVEESPDQGVGRELSSYGVTSASRPSFPLREPRAPVEPRAAQPAPSLVPAPGPVAKAVVERLMTPIEAPRPPLSSAPFPGLPTISAPAVTPDFTASPPVRLRVSARNGTRPPVSASPETAGEDLAASRSAAGPDRGRFPLAGPPSLPSISLAGAPTSAVRSSAPLLPLSGTSFPLRYPASAPLSAPTVAKKKVPIEWGMWMARLLALGVVAALGLLAAVLWFGFDYTPYLPSKLASVVNHSEVTYSSEDPFGPSAAGDSLSKRGAVVPPIIRPAASVAFVNFANGLRISGVVEGVLVRAIVDGRMVRGGDVLDPVLQIRLVGSDADKRVLVLEDNTGAQVEVRY